MLWCIAAFNGKCPFVLSQKAGLLRAFTIFINRHKKRLETAAMRKAQIQMAGLGATNMVVHLVQDPDHEVCWMELWEVQERCETRATYCRIGQQEASGDDCPKTMFLVK